VYVIYSSIGTLTIGSSKDVNYEDERPFTLCTVYTCKQHKGACATFSFHSHSLFVCYTKTKLRILITVFISSSHNCCNQNLNLINYIRSILRVFAIIYSHFLPTSIVTPVSSIFADSEPPFPTVSDLFSTLLCNPN